MKSQPTDLAVLRQRLATLNIIANFNLGLSATLDLDTIERTLFEAILQVTGAQRCALLLAGEQPLTCRMCFPEEQFRVERSEIRPGCPASQILEARQHILWNQDVDPGGSPPACRAAPHGMTSYIGVPMTVGGQVIGVIEAIEPVMPENGGQQADLLEAIATPAGLAIQNALLYQQAMEEKGRVEQLQATVSRLLGTYLPPLVADMMVAKPDQAQPGGALKEVTVLFVDLEDFTTLAESKPPQECVALLNESLSGMIEKAYSFGGTPAGFTGDGLMVMFNAPVYQKDHPWQAVQAAAAMQEYVASQGLSVQINSGLHSGEAIVGNIGGQGLLNYTAIGDTVNVAARLQDMAHGGQILITETVYEQIRDRVQAEFLGEHALKGRQQATKVYSVITG